MDERGEMCNSWSTSIMPTHGLFLSILVRHFKTVLLPFLCNHPSAAVIITGGYQDTWNYILMSIAVARKEKYWLIIDQVEAYRREYKYQCCMRSLPPGNRINIAFIARHYVKFLVVNLHQWHSGVSSVRDLNANTWLVLCMLEDTFKGTLNIFVSPFLFNTHH